MIYLARRLDTLEIVEFDDDPDYVVGHGETLVLPLDGHRVLCERVRAPHHVVATDRRKRFNSEYREVRSDGRLSTMQLPDKQQAEALGLPPAPYYTRNGEASFMTREQAADYAKRLNDHDPSGDYEFDA